MILFNEPIKRILTVIFLQVVFALLTYSLCLAYFSVEPVKRSIKTITSQTDALPSSASYYFVWSDNDEFHRHFSPGVINSPQTSRRYLFAFYIPILEKVTQQSGRYFLSEFSLDNLLYANLKIERLINEYNRLKARSRPVLEGLNVPYISWIPAFESYFEKRDHSISKKIDYMIDHPDIFAGQALIGSKTVDSTNHINSQRTLHSRAKRPLYNTQPPINSSSYSNNQSRRVSDPKLDPSALKKDVQYYDGLDNQLPWFFRFLLSLLNYAIKNKAKVIIYIFILLGVYHVFFRIRK